MSYSFQSFLEETQHIREWLAKEYSQISTGRVSPALLDSVMVETYGSKQPIKNVASISIEDPRTLRISPWDSSLIKLIEKGLTDSALPFALGVDSKGIRASLPQLTEESKKTILKLLKEKLEEARVKIRALRNGVEKELDSAKKEGAMSEDDVFRTKETLQKHVTQANTEVENLFATKEKDIMS